MTLNKGLIALPSTTAPRTPEDLAISSYELKPKKIKTTKLVVHLPIYPSHIEDSTTITQVYGFSQLAIALLAAHEIPMLAQLVLGFECVHVEEKSLPVIEGHFVIELNDNRTIDEYDSEILVWYMNNLRSITHRLLTAHPYPTPPPLG